MDPDCLEIEITESTLMDDSEFVIDKLKKLKSRGIKISIDDFGTGYSSMSYLKNFPVNKLKIDKSFVSGLPLDNEDIAITQAILTMAHGLGISVVAEGVETKEQADFLNTHGCDYLQGYYYSKPVTFSDFLSRYSLKKNTGDVLKIVKDSPAKS